MFPARLFLVLPLIAGMLAFAQGEKLDRAVELTREKRYAEARAELRGVSPPSDPQLRLAFHRLQAAIASGLKQPAIAAREMNRALALAPADPGLLLATAVAEQQAGLVTDALRHLAKVRDTAPSAQAETLAGDIEESRGNYVQAAQAYQRAIELAPADEQYRLNLALELVVHHTFEPATAVLEQAAAVFPRSARVRTLLGVAYFAQAKVAEAAASLTAALSIDPAFGPAREYLTRIALDAQVADAQWGTAICAAPDWACAAVRLRVNRDDAAAFNDLSRLAPSAPPDARCELARAYEWREQWQQARPAMEVCVHADPADPQRHYRLARIYQRLGLSDLAARESELQKLAARRAAAETERRRQAVQSFQTVVRP